MKLIRNFAVLFIVIFSLLVTGCPAKEKTIRQFKEKGAQLSVYGTRLITAFGDAYKAHEITREQLASLNEGTALFVKGVTAYREAVDAAAAIAQSGQPLPPDLLGKLNTILASQVIDTFLGLLVKVGVLPIAESEVIKTALTGIRLTLLAIKAVFSDAGDLMRYQEVNAHGA